MDAELNLDKMAVGNVRYTLDSLAELDHECGCRSGIGLFPYRLGDGRYGVELKLTSAITHAGVLLELIDTTTYLEDALFADMAEELALGIERHALGVKTSWRRLSEQAREAGA